MKYNILCSFAPNLNYNYCMICINTISKFTVRGSRLNFSIVGSIIYQANILNSTSTVYRYKCDDAYWLWIFNSFSQIPQMDVTWPNIIYSCLCLLALLTNICILEQMMVWRMANNISNNAFFTDCIIKMCYWNSNRIRCTSRKS